MVKKRKLKIFSMLLVLALLCISISSIFLVNKVDAASMLYFAQNSYATAKSYDPNTLFNTVWDYYYPSNTDDQRQRMGNFLCLHIGGSGADPHQVYSVIDINPYGDDPTYYEYVTRTGQKSSGNSPWALPVAYMCYKAKFHYGYDDSDEFNANFGQLLMDGAKSILPGITPYQRTGYYWPGTEYYNSKRYNGDMGNGKTIAARIVVFSAHTAYQETDMLFGDLIDAQAVKMKKYITRYRDLDTDEVTEYSTTRKAYDENTKKTKPAESKNNHIRVNYTVDIENTGTKDVQGKFEDFPDPSHNGLYLTDLTYNDTNVAKAGEKITIPAKTIVTFRFTVLCSEKVTNSTLQNQAKFTIWDQKNNKYNKVVESSDYIKIAVPPENYQVKKYVFKVEDGETKETKDLGDGRQAALLADKSANPVEVLSPGSKVFYKISVTNNGSTTIKGYLQDDFSKKIFEQDGYKWTVLPNGVEADGDVIDTGTAYQLKTKEFEIKPGKTKYFRLSLTTFSDETKFKAGKFQNIARFVTKKNKKSDADYIQVPKEEFEIDKYISQVVALEEAAENKALGTSRAGRTNEDKKADPVELKHWHVKVHYAILITNTGKRTIKVTLTDSFDTAFFQNLSWDSVPDGITVNKKKTDEFTLKPRRTEGI